MNTQRKPGQEQKCKKCMGTGKVPSKNGKRKCVHCRGCGEIQGGTYLTK